jgi:ligand-binding sensor domain-containing protein
MQLNNSGGKLLMAQQKFSGTNVTDKRIGIWNGSSFDFYTGVFNIERPMQVLSDKNGDLWQADFYRGLVHRTGGNFDAVIPNSPNSITSREMVFYNGSMWVTSSDILNSWSPVFNKNGIYKCTDYNWENYTIYNTPEIDSIYDVAVVEAIPSQNKLIFGTQDGILEFDAATNTFLLNKYRPGVTGTIEPQYRITGAYRDQQDNVWLSDTYSNRPIICRKADGTYVYFSTGFLNGINAKDILVDDNNQVWVAKESGSGGLVILNYGNDIDDKSDDQFFNLAAGRGYGNLPVNSVNCLAKDKDGVIWIGTTQGIAIISCSAYVTDNACEAEQICVDRNDGSGFCDNLLEDEIINCITVDAANRKWIGTTNGLFLVSADGQKTIHYFNESNSPLLANYVRSVTINPVNGDLFIGTEKGICTYRADATTTTSDTPEPFVYPNPVRADYDGPIAITGIPNNSNVKIVDVSGNLVYETTALGGQATWDGKLVNGERAATGVYFALCQGSGKKEKAKLKFVLIH